MYLGANRFVKNMAKTDSRTSKSIKNSSVALVFYFINLILQFFSRKIFLDYLGAEVLGLNTTATNLLQFLNLAELGVGAAIACTLYKPLAEKDTDTINEIVSLQGWLYRMDRDSWKCGLDGLFPLDLCQDAVALMVCVCLFWGIIG